MEERTISILFEKKISRLFIFRPLWMLPVAFVITFWMFWMYLVLFLHFFYMLLMGKRNEFLWNQTKYLFVYAIEWNKYILCLVNKRPKIFKFKA